MHLRMKTWNGMWFLATKFSIIEDAIGPFNFQNDWSQNFIVHLSVIERKLLQNQNQQRCIKDNIICKEF